MRFVYVWDAHVSADRASDRAAARSSGTFVVASTAWAGHAPLLTVSGCAFPRAQIEVSAMLLSIFGGVLVYASIIGYSHFFSPDQDSVMLY